MTPAVPKDKTIDQLVDVLKKHFEPKPLVIAEHFNFNKRSQLAPGDLVKEFAAELRCLTIHCNFAAHLDKALRDHFVCRMKNETIQKRLLTERKLMFTGALDIAHGMEQLQ